LLIGGGIMSATLGTWLQELEPDSSFYSSDLSLTLLAVLFSAGDTIVTPHVTTEAQKPTALGPTPAMSKRRMYC
jgi:hypothetical protein